MKCKMFMKNFGEFYNNQIEMRLVYRAEQIPRSSSEKKLDEVVAMIREKNPEGNHRYHPVG